MAELLQKIQAGDSAALDRLCDALRPLIHAEASRMLGPDDQEVDDVTQESLLATAGYLTATDAFEGSVPRLAVTIARNRCRDILARRRRRPQAPPDTLADWLADPGRSALDDLIETEQSRIMSLALEQLDAACRSLLRAIYVERVEARVLQENLGLGTVFAVYQRRRACVDRLKKIVQRHLRFGSLGGDGTGMAPGGGAKGRNPR